MHMRASFDHLNVNLRLPIGLRHTQRSKVSYGLRLDHAGQVPRSYQQAQAQAQARLSDVLAFQSSPEEVMHFFRASFPASMARTNGRKPGPIKSRRRSNRSFIPTHRPLIRALPRPPGHAKGDLWGGKRKVQVSAGQGFVFSRGGEKRTRYK